MNYSKHYNLLIERAKNRILDSYVESHHIVPRCMGGSDDFINLVDLTPEEHYLAHQLLVKIYPSNMKLALAAGMMIPGRKSNKMYGWLKRRFAAAMSELQTGINNSNYGTRWIHNKTLQVSKKINKLEETPAGWFDGRILKWDKIEKRSKAEMYEQKRIHTKKMAQDLFDSFKNSEYTSISKFAIANGTTQPRLCMLWKAHVEEYRKNRVHGKSFKKGL